MLGLDLIGAGENLAAYTIMVKIRKVDPDKLRKVAAGDASWGGILPMAITVADSAPKASLEIVLPIVKAQMEKIGITADLSTTEKAPKTGAPHEMAIVLGAGTVLGLALALLYRLVRG